MTRLGYQMPNFTYPGVDPSDLYATVAQLFMIGPPELEMPDCYTCSLRWPSTRTPPPTG